jgi:hypothetical protein
LFRVHGDPTIIMVGFGGDAGCPHPEGTRRRPHKYFFAALRALCARSAAHKKIILKGLPSLQTSRWDENISSS